MFVVCFVACHSPQLMHRVAPFRYELLYEYEVAMTSKEIFRLAQKELENKRSFPPMQRISDFIFDGIANFEKYTLCGRLTSVTQVMRRVARDGGRISPHLRSLAKTNCKMIKQTLLIAALAATASAFAPASRCVTFCSFIAFHRPFILVNIAENHLGGERSACWSGVRTATTRLHMNVQRKPGS